MRHSAREAGQATWAQARNRSIHTALWVCVLLVHGLVLLGWRGSLQHAAPPVAEPAARVLTWLRLVPAADQARPATGLPATPESPAPAMRRPQVAPATPVPPRLRSGEADVTSAPSATSAEPTAATWIAPPEPAPSAPRERLIDSAATRQAIRDAARQPLLSERAQQATDIAPVTQAERLSAAAGAAGKGDCLKGQYAGGGMGILSLPFLAVAAATGGCAK